MPHHRLALLGFGNVGKALSQLLLQKEDELREVYDITFSVCGVATGRHGMAIDPNGLDLPALLDSGDVASFNRVTPPTNVIDFIHQCGADILFENTPVNYESGQPAVEYITTGLSQGMHVITANKGPVVHAYQDLTALGKERKRRFFFESTVMDGAPIFSLFRETLPTAKLHSLRGVLNSTTNMILTRMEQGEEFDQAVSYCQKIGIAETDPSGDVDGWDAAVKVAALVTVLMGISLSRRRSFARAFEGSHQAKSKRRKREGSGGSWFVQRSASRIVLKQRWLQNWWVQTRRCTA